MLFRNLLIAAHLFLHLQIDLGRVVQSAAKCNIWVFEKFFSETKSRVVGHAF